MKSAALITAALTTVLAGNSWDHFHTWSPPGPDDVRAPCPMLNSLANHGFLPHDGKNIDENTTVNALYSALNVNQSLGSFLYNFAITTNPTPNATTYSLNDLSNHNILEHDASLSRADFYWGDDHTFNQSVFDETRSYWTDEIIDVQMAANARKARVDTSNATNPTFSLSDLGTSFGYGETAAYILVLGDKESSTVNRTLVEYLFENERLPLELGWHRPHETLEQDDLFDLLDKVINATSSSPAEAVRMRKRVKDIHVGL